MTVSRHPKGTPTGGRFAPQAHAEVEVLLDYVPITNEDDTWLPFCDGCGEQSDQIDDADNGDSLCPYCLDNHKANSPSEPGDDHIDLEGEVA